MNFYVILHAIIGISVVLARPVDVDNDNRPLINYISPSDADNLVIILTNIEPLPPMNLPIDKFDE